jgi:hypothetical protein
LYGGSPEKALAPTATAMGPTDLTLNISPAAMSIRP